MEESVEYDPKTALLVVDVQNDFADPSGNLYVRGGERIPAVVNDEIDQALRAGALVVYTQDWHPHTTPHFEKDGGVWPVHCVAGSWGAEFHPELHVKGEVVRKGSGGEDGYSGFSVRDPRSDAVSDTQLESLLRSHGIERIVIAGLATDYCVKETALDAIDRGIQTVVLTDAIGAVDLEAGDGQKALEEIEKAGARLE